jgi:hypothetical protein
MAGRTNCSYPAAPVLDQAAIRPTRRVSCPEHRNARATYFTREICQRDGVHGMLRFPA